MKLHIRRASGSYVGSREAPPCAGATFHPWEGSHNPDEGYWTISVETIAELMDIAAATYDLILSSGHPSFAAPDVVGTVMIYDDYIE